MHAYHIHQEKKVPRQNKLLQTTFYLNIRTVFSFSNFVNTRKEKDKCFLIFIEF